MFQNLLGIYQILPIASKLVKNWHEHLLQSFYGTTFTNQSPPLIPTINPNIEFW